MNMAGKLKREGSPVKVRHVAEVLAGDYETPAHRGGRMMDTVNRHLPRRMSSKALADGQAAICHDGDGPALHRQAHQGPRGAARVRRAARPGARHQGPRARPSRHLPRALRGEGEGDGRPRALGRHARRRPAPPILAICRKAEREDRHQGQVDDLGGDRPQPAPRSQRHRRRSRPTSANTSSSSATSGPATSSRPPCT